jgi:hypothetical protein
MFLVIFYKFYNYLLKTKLVFKSQQRKSKKTRPWEQLRVKTSESEEWGRGQSSPSQVLTASNAASKIQM